MYNYVISRMVGNKMKNIAWLPESLNANKSIYQFKKAAEIAGFNNFSEKELNENLSKTDYLVLNFFEDIQKKWGFYFICFWGRYFRLLKFKLHGIKILWVLNNKIPHDDNAKWAVRMMKVLVKKSYKIICLCSDSKFVLKSLVRNENIWKDKLLFLPHPNYIGAYKVSESKIDTSKFKALFFGSIRPYKNIDTLIKVFKDLPDDKAELLIAGNVKKPEYKEYLIKLAENCPYIKLELKYISDDEIISLIQQSSIVILPYDNQTTLNSGSVILACSAKRTFITSMIGTVSDFSDKTLFYSYSYTDEVDHVLKLKEQILNAYNDYLKNPNSLFKKGMKLYEYINKEHSLEIISKILQETL